MIVVQTNEYRGHCVFLSNGIEIIFQEGLLEKTLIAGLKKEEKEE